MIITQVGDERFRKIGQGLKTPGCQVLFKDSASVLDEVLRDNEAREFINVQALDCHFVLSASRKIYKINCLASRVVPGFKK